MSHDGHTPSFVVLDEAGIFANVPAEPEPAKPTLPAVPPWVTDVRKWQTLTRAERRALERHHRRQGKK